MPRLKISLTALTSGPQFDNWRKYPSTIRGWLLRKLSGTPYGINHEKKIFRPFCFSHMCGVKANRLDEGQKYYFMVSSPYPELLRSLREVIVPGETFNISDILFRVDSCAPIGACMPKDGCVMNTPTGIVLTEKNEEGKIKYITPIRNSIEKFRSALEKNLINKFNHFHRNQKFTIPATYPLLKGVGIENGNKPEVAMKYQTSQGDEFVTVGSRVVLWCGLLDNVQKKVLGFCFDTGFGTHSSYGRGFMMIYNKKKGDIHHSHTHNV